MTWRPLPLALLVACAGTVDPDEGDADSLTSTDRPTKRSEVNAIADPVTGDVMIFGGNDGPIVNQRASAKFLKDTWVFTRGIGWTEVVGDGPSKRGRYVAGLDPDQGRGLIFSGRFRKGGETGDYTLPDDLWAFDFTTRTWSELDDGSGEGPAGRYYAAGAWDPGAQRLWSWGGAVNIDPLVIEPTDELWSWSDEEGWRPHDTTGDGPSTRIFFGDTWDSQRNRLIVFGGQVGDFSSLAYQDLYALDLDDLSWERLHDGESSKAPSTRMHAALEYDAERDRYLLFGGHTDLGDANDLWAFDPGSLTWEKLQRGDKFTGERLGCVDNPSEVPADYVDQDLTSPERRHRGMHAILDDQLWLFGGMHAECSDHLDDTWRLDLETGVWSEVIEARTGESCLRRGDDCACLCL